MRINAKSFEITREIDKQSKSRQPLFIGFVGVDDTNAKAFEALKDLSSKQEVDKIIIVYHDYAFSLMGVSLTAKDNYHPLAVTFETRYKFCAKDIQLERSAEQ